MGETSSELIGLVLKDTYRIDTYLGEGGPSIVYKGTDLLLGVPVAIKRLKLLQQNEEQRELMAERFLREARTQAKLVHQNIVGIRAMLEEKGEYYIIMEFIDGKDLAYRLFDTEGHSKKLPFDEVVPLYEQALAGLGYAHEHGVIHRDIKPENLLVTFERGGRARVVLADFGSAVEYKNDTRWRSEVGSPFWQSPEAWALVRSRVPCYAIDAIAATAFSRAGLGLPGRRILLRGRVVGAHARHALGGRDPKPARRRAERAPALPEDVR
ncbi:MAG TPA: hypothetical protein DCE42_02155 [Myxococcales bacterium]|nr:hypothetical protein [Myxococcales bacterium]